MRKGCLFYPLSALLAYLLWIRIFIYSGERTDGIDPGSELWSPFNLATVFWNVIRTSGTSSSSSHLCDPSFADSIVTDVWSSSGDKAEEYTGSKPHLVGACKGMPQCPFVWVTMASHCSAGANSLSKALKERRIPLAIVGHGAAFRGFGYRIRLYHDYLTSLPADTLVVLSDADDVFLVPGCHKEDFLKAYLEFPTPIIFGAEPYPWPIFDNWPRYPEIPVSSFQARSHLRPTHRYLNAGTIMGPAGALAQLIRSIYTDESADDQGLFTEEFLRRWEALPSYEKGKAVPHNDWKHMGITLDYYQNLFLSAQATSFVHLKIEAKQGRIRSRATGGRPCLVHQNGDKSYEFIEPIQDAFVRSGWSF